MDHIVTCHQPGCENVGQRITLTLNSDVSVVICGPCGQLITDIQPPLNQPNPVTGDLDE